MSVRVKVEKKCYACDGRGEVDKDAIQPICEGRRISTRMIVPDRQHKTCGVCDGAGWVEQIMSIEELATYLPKSHRG